MRQQVRRILRRINVRGGKCGVPGRLSNKRRRHVIVTQTVLGGPRVVLTSRPANGLSIRAKQHVIRLLRSVYHRNSTVLVAARGLGLLSRCPKGICGYRRRHLARAAGSWGEREDGEVFTRVAPG